MDTQTVLYSIYVAVMATAALVIAYWWVTERHGLGNDEYFVHFMIVAWSGLAYLSLAFGQGIIEVSGQTVHLARYLDWVVTTPLLLLALAMTGMHYITRDRALIGGLIAADVVMILSGLLADLSLAPLQYVWYVIGCGAFVTILWIIWSPLRAKAESQGQDLYRHFLRVAGFLTVLWVGYPLFWIIGPSGFGLVGPTTDTALFVALPIISKAVWSLVDLVGLRALNAPEGAEASRPSAAGGET